MERLDMVSTLAIRSGRRAVRHAAKGGTRQRSQGDPGDRGGDSGELSAQRLRAARSAGFGQGPVSSWGPEDRARATSMGRRACEERRNTLDRHLEAGKRTA